MAKKTDSKSKPAAPAKGPAKPAAKAKKSAPIKPAVVTEPIVPAAPVVPVAAAPVKPAPAKPAANKPKAVKTAKPKVTKTPKAPTFTRDDVALRAYFIAEKRRHQGIHGDEHQDWVEAERQLLAEATSPKKAVKA